MDLPPECHNLNWLVINNFSSFAVDSLNTNIFDFSFDILGKGDLVVLDRTAGDGGHLC